jgi:hypothetical protein
MTFYSDRMTWICPTFPAMHPSLPRPPLSLPGLLRAIPALPLFRCSTCQSGWRLCAFRFPSPNYATTSAIPLFLPIPRVLWARRWESPRRYFTRPSRNPSQTTMSASLSMGLLEWACAARVRRAVDHRTLARTSALAIECVRCRPLPIPPILPSLPSSSFSEHIALRQCLKQLKNNISV